MCIELIKANLNDMIMMLLSLFGRDRGWATMHHQLFIMWLFTKSNK